MRLFTAVIFDENTKNSLYRMVERLRDTASGTFTERENLHLTVNFIGETDRLNEVEQAMDRAMDAAGVREFTLTTQGSGSFKRNEGDIYWIGIEREDTLWRLQKELVYQFKKVGFRDIEDKEYKPHLTLGRRVIPGSGFDRKNFEAGVPKLRMNVERISLMKSERIRGKLIYTEIYSIRLKQPSF